jgi:Rrf2 family protein
MQNSLALEYALHSLHALASLPSEVTEGALSVKHLAHLMGVTPSYLAKIFTQLSKAGLVRTAVGSKGGVSLVKPPDQITFYDVFLAINGRPNMFQCANIRTRALGTGIPVGMCEIHRTMWQAEEAMYAHLKQVTIQDIVERVNGKHSPEEVERGRQMVCQFLQSLR